MHDLPSNRRIPEGVDPISWLGFEHRIGQRRFAALIRAVSLATESGDVSSAQAALDEARELCPDAPELLRLEATVAAMTPASDTRLWTRAAGAVALLAVGVSMVIGLESLSRVGETPDRQALAAPDTVTGLGVETRPPANFASLSGPQPPVSDSPQQFSVPLPPDPQPRVVVASSRTPAPALAVELDRPAEARRTPRPLVSTPPTPPRRAQPSALLGAPSRNSTLAPVAPQTLEAPVPTAPQIAPAAELLADARPVAPAPPATLSDKPVLPAAPIANTVSEDRSRVADVLRRYARAYGALDASAARDVWPSVDQRALARAFGSLRSQELSLQECEIDVHGTSANASCRGQAQYVGKVGSGEPRIESRTWHFELRREGEAWKIANAETRRPTS
jgi:hypothetical protein